jgi:hypothetical protein
MNIEAIEKTARQVLFGKDEDEVKRMIKSSIEGVGFIYGDWDVFTIKARMVALDEEDATANDAPATHEEPTPKRIHRYNKFQHSWETDEVPLPTSGWVEKVVVSAASHKALEAIQFLLVLRAQFLLERPFGRGSVELRPQASPQRETH